MSRRGNRQRENAASGKQTQNWGIGIGLRFDIETRVRFNTGFLYGAHRLKLRCQMSSRCRALHLLPSTALTA
jgi:hypothetical protein